MKLLLLILSLITGLEAAAVANVKMCPNGWVQFVSEYPDKQKDYQDIDIDVPSKTLRISQKDVWENKGGFSLYHDTQNKHLKVTIKHLEREDFGEYRFKFYGRYKQTQDKDDYQEGQRVHLEADPHRCQTPVTQAVHRGAKTTITCDYTTDEFEDLTKFFCKGNSFTCEVILSPKSPPVSNRKFTVKHTKHDFSVSISDVSSQDAGIYWCGAESHDGRYKFSLKQIQLEVKESPATSPSSTSSTSKHPSAISSTTQTPPATSQSDAWLTVIITTAVFVTLLVLVVTLVFVYKRFEHSKYKTNGEEQNREHNIYEEIRESTHRSDARAAINSVYTKATFPVNTSAFMAESRVSVKNSSDEVTSDTYLTLWDSDQCPTKTETNHPSTVSTDPSYSLLSPYHCSTEDG